MKYILIFLLLCLGTITMAQGQNMVHGHVFGADINGETIPLEKAQVFWLNTSRGTLTDAEGHFMLDRQSGDTRLVIRMASYESDTLDVTSDHVKITLTTASLDAVEISRRQRATRVNSFDPSSTQILNSLELTKAACCNLSETFETNATVDIAYSDAVTGAKRIRMLGLDGIYTQVLGESYPYLRGLVQSYGLTYVPGPFLTGIQVSKGAASVQNGYESLTGEINVEFMKPQSADPVFVNLFANTFGRQEANVALAHRFSPYLSTMVMAHGSRNPRAFDDNGDGFLDLPVSHQQQVFNRWRWITNDGWRGQFGVKYLEEESQSGQMDYDPATDRLTTNAYGVELDTRRWEAFNKLGYVFPSNPNSSIGSVVSFSDHRQRNSFGLNQYEGDQRSLFAKVLFGTTWGEPEHRLTTGLSYRHDDYSEVYNDSAFTRQERVPGAFFEYSYNKLGRLIYTVGARVDAHNLYGVIFTPRAHLKYDFNVHTTVRLSGGSGFRVPNLIADNTSLLISSRQLRVLETPDPERGWNYGLSLIQRIYLAGDQLITLDLSAFRTHFENQIVVNREQPGIISFSNLDGKSFSEAVQLDASYEVQEGIEFRLSGKYTRARSTFNGQVLDLPFVPRFRGLANVGLSTKDLRWQYDLNLQWVGSGRFPNTNAYPEQYRLGERSPDFGLLSSQLTYRFKNPKLELYIGGENLTNFTQADPILASEDPFNPFFDAAMNYGPIVGRRFYAGLRFTLPKKQ